MNEPINNIDQIRENLVFDNEDDFYQIQIIKRRKENPGLKNNAKVVKEYYAYSLEYYDEISQELRDICLATRSRVYINLNVRSFKNAAFATLELMITHLHSGDYKSVRASYTKSASSRTSRKRAQWLIDFDKNEGETEDQFRDRKQDFAYALMGFKVQIINSLHTPNGIHFIVAPFDRVKFFEKNPAFDIYNIKKNSPTILFSPIY